MNLFSELVKLLPELEDSKAFTNGEIILQDDSDGLGAYIVKWDYEKPLPEGFKIGK